MIGKIVCEGRRMEIRILPYSKKVGTRFMRKEVLRLASLETLENIHVEEKSTNNIQ